MASQALHKFLESSDALKGFNLKPQQLRNAIPQYCLGHNIAIDPDNLQDLTTFGEDYITQPTTLTAMGVQSDSVEDDNGGGTGAKKIQIHGLDGNWQRKTQVVELNGTAEVTVDEDSNTIEFLKVNHINVIDPSPTNAQHTAVGNITLEAAGGGTVYGKIDAGGNMELAARVAVPSGFTMYIPGWNASAGKVPAQGDEIMFLLRGTLEPNLRTLLTNVFIFQDVMHLASGSNYNPLVPALTFPEKCEIKVSAQLSGAGSAVGSASFRYWLVPNH